MTEAAADPRPLWARFSRSTTRVPGLVIIYDVVTPAHEEALLALAWPAGQHARTSVGYRNRIERYGAGMPRAACVCGDVVSTQMPKPYADLCELVEGVAPLMARPNIVNVCEYLEHQGMPLHADRHEELDSPDIASLNLAAAVTLRFRRDRDPTTDIMVIVPRRALFVMRPPCRSFPWEHAVEPVTAPRVSVIFRHVDMNGSARERQILG